MFHKTGDVYGNVYNPYIASLEVALLSVEVGQSFPLLRFLTVWGSCSVYFCFYSVFGAARCGP